ELTAWTAAYRDGVDAAMAADGYPMSPYVSFRMWHDPTSGLKGGAATPRFSQGYTAIQNRPGLLVETHMLKPYAVRVESALRLVIHTLRWCGERAPELRRLVGAADARAASAAFRAEPFPLSFRSDGDSTLIDFLGVEMEEVPSDVTGGTYFRYSDRPATWRIPYFDSLEPATVAALPAAYLVPPAWTEALDRLAAHGIAFTRLTEPREVAVRSWRLTNPAWGQAPYEGHHTVTFTAEPETGVRTFPAGTAVVGLDQRAARVIAHLLEPKAPDSLVQWGYFDPIFERVEYVESYVIEQMIPQLLADNPEWEAELNAAKAANPDFAADPWAIRYWFYARTPYYDDRVGLYPIASIDDESIYRDLINKSR
ncbi:peptidase M14, partial [bacterium]|nr:peptidase M14 [bacterium]